MDTIKTRQSTKRLINITFKRYGITAANGYILRDNDQGVVVGSILITTVKDAIQLTKHLLHSRGVEV